MKIDRFKMRPNVSLNNIKCIREGGSWIHENAIQFISIPIHDKYPITLNIGFPEDLSKWDDFEYVIVLDEEFGQPYAPFYSFMNKPWLVKIGSALYTIIQNYNEEMRALPFLEEIKGIDLQNGAQRND